MVVVIRTVMIVTLTRTSMVMMITRTAMMVTMTMTPMMMVARTGEDGNTDKDVNDDDGNKGSDDGNKNLSTKRMRDKPSPTNTISTNNKQTGATTLRGVLHR